MDAIKKWAPLIVVSVFLPGGFIVLGTVVVVALLSRRDGSQSTSDDESQQ